MSFSTKLKKNQLFWDYYDFTRDKQLLKDHIYPTLLGMAQFLSKTVKPQQDGTLLVDPSFSPEQVHQQAYYRTKGCIFDQSMILETYHDLLEAAQILNKKDPFLETIRKQIDKLDAIQIGTSGQIKEFREEKEYGEIGQYEHRHISQLCAMYPGTLINSNTPEWLEAAKVTLQKRGDQSTGWGMAHRQNLWARAKNGNKAYELYRNILTYKTLENLWGTHPPFQIDANFGATAGIAEMLLQSHEGYIDPLAAIPDKWKDGSFSGLMARGNFQVSATWKDGNIRLILVHSNMGEVCRLKCSKKAYITDSKEKPVKFKVSDSNIIEFNTRKGETYKINIQED